MKLGYEDNGDGTATLKQVRTADDPLGQRPALTIRSANPQTCGGDQFLLTVCLPVELARDIVAGLELLDTVRRSLPTHAETLVIPNAAWVSPKLQGAPAS